MWEGAKEGELCGAAVEEPRRKLVLIVLGHLYFKIPVTCKSCRRRGAGKSVEIGIWI